ncbi:MAG: hypothetical protein IJ446_00520 [Oscillospiraceae bacterium]|nr:hypothetical protein [Oscillospiraceae bacterium]
MGRQVEFSMTTEDVAEFIKILNIKMKGKIKILSEKQADEMVTLVETEETEKNNMSGWYYLWNTDFKLDKTCFKSSTELHELPLIEFFCGTKGIPPKGRIYWNSYLSPYYSDELFISWYNKCVRLLKENAFYKYGKVYKTYVYKKSWENYKEHHTDEYTLEGKPDDYFYIHEKYKNILLLKMKNNCINKCPDCKKNKEAYPFRGYGFMYTKAFDLTDITGIEYLFVGVGYDPITSDCGSLLNYIKNKSDIKVIGITNGVCDEKLLSDSIKKDIDELYVFIPSDDPDEYYDKTNSKAGIYACEKITAFLKNIKRYYKHRQLAVKHSLSRNEIYEMLCEKYGKT